MNDKETLRLAYQLAQKGHAGQTRNDGVTPYLTHVYEVATWVRREWNDVSTTVVAILHDVVEDTHITLEYLEQAGFSREILDAVDAITHPKSEPYADYINRVFTNPIALKVKYMDIISNMADEPTPESQENYRKFLYRIYAEHSELCVIK